MSPKILRRCTNCGNFHASYLVEVPGQEKSYLCYKCWKAKNSHEAAPPPESDPERPEPPVEIGEERGEEHLRVGRKPGG